MGLALQMASQTLHIWHCAQCQLCLFHYRWPHRHCTFGIVHNAICASHTMPFMQSTQCQLCRQCHLCKPHNANCAHNAFYADNAIYAIYTMPIVRTMPFPLSHNAKCAHNAICACHTMPFMHTMPIVHTMPFMRATQCQLCAQCQLCSTFGIVRLHIWHCVGAQLALCDVILYMHITILLDS